MNEATVFDIYLALLQRFGNAKVRIAEQEAKRRRNDVRGWSL